MNGQSAEESDGMRGRVREGLREGVKCDSEEGGRVVDVVVVVYSIY